MAEDDSGAGGAPLLRGLFGVFQNASANHADTASIWSSLRTAAGTWQFQAQGQPQPYSPAEVEAAGRAILSAQGVNAATVSSFRGVAGQWRSAKERLETLESGEQITAPSIFVPPWAITADPAVPTRYRVRTQWQIEPAAGDVFTKWKADEITGPLTDVDALLGDAAPTPDTNSGRLILSGGAPPTLLDYSLEVI